MLTMATKENSIIVWSWLDAGCHLKERIFSLMAYN